MMDRTAGRMRGATTNVLHASLVPFLLAFLVAVLVALGLVVAKPSVAHAGETDTIYSLVNEARWSQGSPGLVRNPAMDTVAANWAGALAQAGTLSHNPDYSSKIPGGWVAAGENVAQGYSGGSAMHDGWMNSPGHRANIFGNFTDIGIAYLEAGGTTWGVQVFANYPGTVTPAAPAAAPAPAVAAPAAPAEPAPVAEDSTPLDAVPAPAATPEPSTATRENLDPSKDTRAGVKPTANDDEISDTANSVTNAAGPSGAATPLWSAILGTVIVAAAANLSYRLRSKRDERVRHTA
ncbi:Uncharacterized conserved protein YkwD, contains CAP (CSP/antigen 5/PR1) domain [Salinibacterium xinjiangense]|uniref:Uncharacterized conserved protein YkwD, contains CAP (CSP/antigen 5/PR1) domain n=2 Tax=Salinibacterium xinjiangense TaxID=386302 RepID=A0A2C8ZXD4_9MICO|nr:Uncharacterized conserved protein YkwD, contains CAP (CSP/antigen 5/PR1) domain [Salinibacterium xinjiangense]